MHYMHLFHKSPKYAFAYASMQMHNYPKPIHECVEARVVKKKILKLGASFYRPGVSCRCFGIFKCIF